MDWETTEKHLYETKEAYEDIGWVGGFALQTVINPLVRRYEDGERGPELYEEIWELK